MSPKNLALAAATALLTLLVALLALRRLAPRLVGAPVEVKIVQSSEQVPPFYDHVFDRAGTTEPLPDPVTGVREPGLQRARPGAGPTDVLGFRNPAVMNTPDVVTIGDSQTYGVGVALADTWPQRLAALLGPPAATVYNMSGNGWGPAQYVAMARVAGRLRPRLVVVAYYTGNDPHDAFAQAYNNPLWKRLRVSATLGPRDGPRVVWPVPAGDRWEVAFRGGVRSVFTPGYRLAANDRSSAGVREGYDIIAKTATVIARSLEDSGAHPVFTVVPTKELVHAPRVRAEGLRPPPAYDALVTDEARNVAELAERLRGMRRAEYVDLLEPLQQAAGADVALYPPDADGHPTPAGHEAIARALAPRIRRALAAPAPRATPPPAAPAGSAGSDRRPGAGGPRGAPS